MKLTKRILSVLTAAVLCLAPMALMVGAAESTVYGVNVDVCDCNNPGQPWGGVPYGKPTNISQAYWCQSQEYIGGYFTCLTCGETQAIDGYSRLIAHPTVYYKEDGSYYCPVCGYNVDE